LAHRGETKYDNRDHRRRKEEKKGPATSRRGTWATTVGKTLDLPERETIPPYTDYIRKRREDREHEERPGEGRL